MLDARQLVGTHDVLFVTLLFACGGVKPGQVLGAIDKTAAFPPPNP